MKELTCKECKGFRMAYWPNTIHKYLKVKQENNEAYQMSESVHGRHAGTFSHSYIHKGHAIYSDISIAKIRDKIVL